MNFGEEVKGRLEVAHLLSQRDRLLQVGIRGLRLIGLPALRPNPHAETLARMLLEEVWRRERRNAAVKLESVAHTKGISLRT